MSVFDFAKCKSNLLDNNLLFQTNYEKDISICKEMLSSVTSLSELEKYTVKEVVSAFKALDSLIDNDHFLLLKKNFFRARRTSVKRLL